MFLSALQSGFRFKINANLKYRPAHTLALTLHEIGKQTIYFVSMTKHKIKKEEAMNETG